MPCVLTHFGAGMTFSCPQLCLDWASSVWPTQWEPLFASPIQQLTDSMDKPGSLLESQRFYRLLARPDIPFRDNATLLLAVGLCHKNPEVHLPSTDILIAAATDRRILPRKLGEVLRFIFDQEMMKPLRPAKIFADVARQSQEHLDFVRDVLEALLLGELKTSLAPFLELLLELCLESNQKIESDELRQSLTLFKGTGKSAKAVKQLLALK